MTYNKHKDASPVDTIHRIRNILDKVGVLTLEEWSESGIEGCHSLRVGIEGTAMGANGKGTNQLYALASGYAELIERMQNNMLYLGGVSTSYCEEQGFILAPDETYIPDFDYDSLDNSFLGHVREKLGQERNLLIGNLTHHRPKGLPDHVITLPFYSLKHHRIDYLIYDFYTAIYGSNGMCAGNTKEEALVQGLSELMERYVNVKLIKNRITPPTVPEEYLKQYPDLYRILSDIRASGRYQVIVKDCSLGEGYPVVGTIIADRQRGTFGMKLGVHPDFPVALERTLTEAFQGARLDQFTQNCTIEYQEDRLLHRDNDLNIMKIGVGSYPPELLAEKSTYDFFPPEQPDGQTNREMLTTMLRKILDQGYDILVRDASYLGFPSYHIIVPGFSEIYPIDEIRLRELTTCFNVIHSFEHFPQITEPEVERIIRYIKFKQTSLIENHMTMLMGKPLAKPFVGGPFEVQFLLGALLYRLGRFQEAYQSFRLVSLQVDQNVQKEAPYYRCVKDYCNAKAATQDSYSIQHQLRQLYAKEVVDRVSDQFCEPENVLEKLYPNMTCYNCSTCEATNLCHYPKTEQTMKRLKELNRENPMDQGALEGFFREILES